MSARYRDNCPLDCKVYVGELGNNGTRHELEEAFGYYGPLKNVWVARNPPGFAFVMFEDPRDARDAVRALNGKVICGRRVRAELSTGKTRREMAQGRYPGSRDGRYSSGGRSPRGRSPRDRERRETYYRESRDSREDKEYYKSRSRRHRSRSRSRSVSPIPRATGGGGSRADAHERANNIKNHSRTPPSRSRSRSLGSKSPRSDSRYR